MLFVDAVQDLTCRSQNEQLQELRSKNRVETLFQFQANLIQRLTNGCFFKFASYRNANSELTSLVVFHSPV